MPAQDKLDSLLSQLIKVIDRKSKVRDCIGHDTEDVCVERCASCHDGKLGLPKQPSAALKLLEGLFIDIPQCLGV